MTVPTAAQPPMSPQPPVPALPEQSPAPAASPRAPRSSMSPRSPQPTVRCGWAGTAPEYLAYHDTEWGRVLHGDDALFERLSLEAFQSGLSWITILRKRPAFRRAFESFQIDRVAEFGSDVVEALLLDAGIVRNRAKIEATVRNARAARQLRAEGGLDAVLWAHAPTEPGQRPGR